MRLNLSSATAVRQAAAEMNDVVVRAGFSAPSFLVQQMAGAGVEMLVGMVNDHVFGPVVVVGAGGTTAELVKDVAMQITPLTDRDAATMVRSLKTFPLLDGYRGRPKTDVASLEKVLLRVAAMVEAHPVIAELDLNPVTVTPAGSVVVDARLRVEQAPARLPLGARRRSS